MNAQEVSQIRAIMGVEDAQLEKGDVVINSPSVPTDNIVVSLLT
jgi:hypothetical protein